MGLFNRKKNNISEEDIALTYDTYFDKLYRFFYYKVFSRENAEDLTSETFVLFVEKLSKENKVEDLKNYLFGIARIVFIKFLKRKYQFTPLEDFHENFLTYVDESLDEADEKETLEEFALSYLDKLPQKQEAILRMRLIDKLSLNEICEKLGKDMNYVKTTQKRGIKKLKELLATSKLRMGN